MSDAPRGDHQRTNEHYGPAAGGRGTSTTGGDTVCIGGPGRDGDGAPLRHSSANSAGSGSPLYSPAP